MQIILAIKPQNSPKKYSHKQKVIIILKCNFC